MNIFRKLFGTKNKIISKREPNTLAEINESPDMRLATVKEREENRISSANQAKKTAKAPAKPKAEILQKSTASKAPVKKATASDEKSARANSTKHKSNTEPTVSNNQNAPSKTEKKVSVTRSVEKTSKKATVETKPDEEISVVKSARTGKFEIKKSKDGRFVFNLYASNNVIVATSQIYSSSSSAMNGIKSVIANAATANIEDQTLKAFTPVPYPKWEIYRDKSDQYRFRLSASNGSCVCHSQGYTSKTNCKKGIESIIKFAADAEITKTYINKDK